MVFVTPKMKACALVNLRIIHEQTCITVKNFFLRRTQIFWDNFEFVIRRKKAISKNLETIGIWIERFFWRVLLFYVNLETTPFPETYNLFFSLSLYLRLYPFLFKISPKFGKNTSPGGLIKDFKRFWALLSWNMLPGSATFVR